MKDSKKKIKEYADKLREGLRADGKTDVECCLEWGILYSDYKEFIDASEDFAEAHELGEMHYSVYWHNLAKQLAEKGNASVLVAGMKNLGIKNWVDKKDQKEEQEAPITAIDINVLPARKDLE